jgi:hypothetical protein
MPDGARLIIIREAALYAAAHFLDTSIGHG